MDDLLQLEKLITTAGALAVLLVLAWRLPLLLKLMLDFGLAVQKENSETVRRCCGHRHTVSDVSSFHVSPQQLGGAEPRVEV